MNNFEYLFLVQSVMFYMKKNHISLRIPAQLVFGCCHFERRKVVLFTLLLKCGMSNYTSNIVVSSPKSSGAILHSTLRSHENKMTMYEVQYILHVMHISLSWLLIRKTDKNKLQPYTSMWTHCVSRGYSNTFCHNANRLL